MSTVVARPVAVDLPRILTSERLSPPPIISRSGHGQALNPPGVQAIDRQADEAARRTQYSPPISLHHAHTPPHRAGFPLPPPHGEPPTYYPPRPPGFHPVAPEPPYHMQPPIGFVPVKRSPPSDFHEPPPKKQSKWTEEEDDTLITLRGENMKWEEIAKHVPGRSAIACRLHYQNFLERRAAWDEEKKNKLAQLYNRLVTAASKLLPPGLSNDTVKPLRSPLSGRSLS